MFQKWLLCIFFLIYFVTTRAENHYRYDYTFIKEAGGWFKFHRVPASFIDAFLRCKLEGAVLASPLNSKLHKVLMGVQSSAKSNCAFLTGIHATLSKGDFTSVEGVPLAKIPLTWAPNEPDNYDDKEDCVIMLPNGTVADVGCNDTYPYVCYRKKTTSPLITACGTLDPGYTFNPSTGSCYKFHTMGKIWRLAQMTCLAEGGHLAIVNSAAEMDVLKALFNKHPANTILNSAYKDSITLGFSDWNQKGAWYTVNGESLEEAGYSSWIANRPNLAKEHRFCGSLYRQGTLDDVWCNVPFAFICEKKPDSLVEEENE